MSFNKFREAASKAPPPGSKGNFVKEAFALKNFQMEPDEVALIRALDPAGPIFSRAFHFWNRPGSCTCDLAVFDGKCVYCFYEQKGKEDAAKLPKLPDGKNQKSKFDKVYRREAYILEIIDYRYFHAATDDSDPAKPKPILITCGNTEALPKRNRCARCPKEPRIFGGRKNWELSIPQFRILGQVDAQIGERCIGAMPDKSVCDRKIMLVGFACGNPEGGHDLMDEESILQLTAEQLTEYCTHEIQCPTCNFVGLPRDITVADDSCPTCGGCSPIRASMFDKNIEATCKGVKGNDGKIKKSYNFDRSAAYSDVRMDLSAHLDAEAVEAMLAPIDLNYVFRPEWVNRDKFENDAEYVMAVLDKQADQLKQVNPYKPVGGPAVTPYQGGGFRRR